MKRNCHIVLLWTLLNTALYGCAQEIRNTGAGNSSTSLTGGNPNIVEVDPVITEEKYQVGLRRAKGLLLNSPFLTPEERSISSQTFYLQKIQEYLDHPQAPRAIAKLYQQLLQLEGTETLTNFDPNSGIANLSLDNDEPSSLAAYIYKNDLSFKEVLTANYCVSNLSQGLTTKECLSQGRRLKNDNQNTPDRFSVTVTPDQLRAGVLSSQAFLKKYAGALNFRRPSKTFEYFLCSVYPDTEETESWTEQNGLLHPAYYTQAGNDQDCQSCHQVLNKTRGFFTGFGPLGEIQMGQIATRIDNGTSTTVGALNINDVEAALIALPNYESTYGRLRTSPFESVINSYHGEAIAQINLNAANPNNTRYADLAAYGRILSESSKFTQCTVQRFYNFAMGIDQHYLNRTPTRIASSLAEYLQSQNYNVKKLLLKIFESTEFLNR